MRIVVCVKQVVDIKFPFLLDQKALVPLPEDTFYQVNPADRSAAEVALGLKEQYGGEVIFVSLGPERVEQALRECLAMGGDRAVRIPEEGLAPGSQAKAYVLAGAVAKLAPDLVLCGSRSLDEGSAETPAALAEYLDFPQVIGVTDLEAPDRKRVVVKRRLERGRREAIECPLPAVVAVEAGMLQPRYAPLQGMIEAFRAPVTLMSSDDLGIDAGELRRLDAQRTQVRRSLPRPRPKKSFSMESGLTAEQRMELLMSGGGRQAKSDMLEGTPREVSVQLAGILREKGITGR